MHEKTEALSGFLDLILYVKNNWDIICDEIRKADQETQDILHEIELTRFNAYEGYELTKKLQEVRQRRRRLKNEKEALKDIKEFYDNNKKLEIDLFKVLSKTRSNISYMENRVYVPKARNDLKLCNKWGERN